MSYWKLGCRWGSKTKGKPLFYNLLIKYQIVIGWEDKDYEKNASVLLTDGHTALGIAKTTSSRKSVLNFPELKKEFEDLQIDYSKHMYVYDCNILDLLESEKFKFKTQVGICGIDKPEILEKIDKLLSDNQEKLMANSIINNYKHLLEYKKQIILQGPPGTGKTREAKEIVYQFFKDEVLSDLFLTTNLEIGDIVKSVKGNTDYVIKNVDTNKVILTGDDIEEKGITKSKIKEFIDKEYWGTVENGNDRGAQALAFFLLQKFLKFQYKLIQFHPSYSYEDFVRGISAKPN